MEGMHIRTTPRNPESAGVDSRGVLRWVKALEEAKLEVHGFVMLRHGEPVAEGWWNPYAPETPHILHSLSKSFTSTAIGFAVSEGLLTVEDTVVSFFPDKLPDALTTNARAMKVKHLLMMGTGHKADFTDSAFARADGDWVRNFFEHAPEEAPGSLFVYNNMATYMCSAIVTKLTGLSVHDYLMPRLFIPLGIGNPYWTACPKGNSAGAFGLRLTTRQISRFGQFLLQKGMWEGRQLLPASWIEEASGIRISSAGPDDKADTPANEWNGGYGYQFWKCLDGSYRADGAFGQICVVSEKHDVVLAFNSGMNDVGQALGLVWEHIWPGLSDSALPENPESLALLLDKLGSLAIAGPKGDISPDAARRWQARLPERVSYSMEENALHISQMDLAVSGNVVTLEALGPKGHFTVKGAFGRWEPGTVNFFIGIAEAPGDEGAGFVSESGDGILQVQVQQLCGPASALLSIRLDGDRLLVGGKMNATFGPADLPMLEGVKI
jgi:CubicO group peptidase (beta-lactamase class C family)